MRKGGSPPGILVELNEKVSGIVIAALDGGALEEGVAVEGGDMEETLDLSEVPTPGVDAEQPGLSDGEDVNEEEDPEEDDDISSDEEGVPGRPVRKTQVPARFQDAPTALPAARVARVPNALLTGCSKCRYSRRGCAACKLVLQ